MGNWDIDWKPVIPSYSRGLDSLGEALARRRDYQLKAKAQEQTARFENEQNANSARARAETERKNKMADERNLAADRYKLSQNLSGLLTKGLPSQAKALAASSMYEDPNQPGVMRGAQLEEEYGAPAPHAAAPDPVRSRNLARMFQGQSMESDDRASTLAGMAPPNETSRASLEPPPFGREPAPQAPPPAVPPQPEPDPNAVEETAQAIDFQDEYYQGKANRTQQRAHDDSLQYRVTFPGAGPDGQPNTSLIDPKEGRRAAAQQAQEDAEQAERAAALETDPVKRSQLLAIATQRRSQMSNTERSFLNNRDTQDDAQGFKHDEAMIHDPTAADKVRIGMRPRAAPQSSGAAGRLRQGEERLDLGDANHARDITRDVLKSYGFTDLQIQNRRFNGMAKSLTANPNAALDAVSAGSFVKMAQGGTGVISDKDMAQFWDKIGGLRLKAGQKWEDVLSGRILPEKRIEVRNAVLELAHQAQGNLETIKGGLDYAHRSDPLLGGDRRWRDQAIGTYFPEDRPAEDAPAPAPPARRHGKPGKPAAASVDDEILNALKELRK